MAKGEIFKSLPPAAKIVVVSVGAAIILFVGYKIYKKISDNKKEEGSRKETDTVKSEEEALNKNPATRATLSKAQMAIFANSLFTAMDGYGTDTNGIYRVFSNAKNAADILGIISAFGIREISSGAGNPEPNFKGSLGGALTVELNKDQLNALNMQIAKKGIKYRF